jgi:hypothetical protein
MIGRSLMEWWDAGEAIPLPDLAAHGVHEVAADLVRRDPLVAAARRVGNISPDVDSWLVAVRSDPMDELPDDITGGEPGDTLRRGAVVDIIVFDPSRPTTWSLQVGIAKVLGRIDPQYLPPLPAVRIHKTPLDWLRAGGDGLAFVFLDRAERTRRARLRDDQRAHYAICDALDIRETLGQLAPDTALMIAKTDIDFAAWLRGILEMPLHRRPIFVERTGNGVKVAA